MSLKTALFKMKQTLIDQNGDLEEGIVKELENYNSLESGALASIYHQLLMVQKNSAEVVNQISDEAKKINRKWTMNEIDFMFKYIKERQREGALNITEILEEIAHLLNRGYQSVNYKYYTLVKNSAKKHVSDQPQQGIKFLTITDEVIPVLSTELIKDSKPTKQNIHNQSNQDDGLLDIVSGLITNIQQLPGIELNQLLKSIFELTSLALQNQNALQQITSIRTEMNQEKQTIQDKLAKAERQLLQEKRRNIELNNDMSLLANEIEEFGKMNDAAKIQNLKNFYQRLDQIIHKFTEVQSIM